MNRVSRLYASGDLAVDVFDHPPHETHHDPEREVAERWAIAFVRSGTFRVNVAGRSERLGRGGVLLMRPGMELGFGHDHECPDDVCTAIGFDESAVAGHEHAWTRAGWVARQAPTPRLAHARRRLESAAESGDAFELERWSLESMAALASDARDERARGPYRPRVHDLDAVVAVACGIERDPAARLSVAARARDVGMTGTRITHAFRRYTGDSPHQYVIRWRIVAATRLLDEGASVSEACWNSGFENLSHFCRVFQRSFACRPSVWASLALPERRRKVQDLVRRVR